ncbi:uncharacterized protein BJ212DRAFT_1414917, partial [Suillus subaureus]
MSAILRATLALFVSTPNPCDIDIPATFRELGIYQNVKNTGFACRIHVVTFPMFQFGNLNWICIVVLDDFPQHSNVVLTIHLVLKSSCQRQTSVICKFACRKYPVLKNLISIRSSSPRCLKHKPFRLRNYIVSVAYTCPS